MAELKIFEQGDVKKCIITSQNPYLDMEACDFYVELKWGIPGRKKTIQKADMLYGLEGEYIMTVDTSKMIGKVTARFVWLAIDTDISPDQRRREVDEQIVCFVATVPNPRLFTCPATGGEGHDVRYEWTDEPDLAAKYLRLCVTETVIPDHGDPYPIYRPLVTRNDEYLYVLRKAAEEVSRILSNVLNLNITTQEINN